MWRLRRETEHLRRYPRRRGVAAWSSALRMVTRSNRSVCTKLLDTHHVLNPVHPLVASYGGPIRSLSHGKIQNATRTAR